MEYITTQKQALEAIESLVKARKLQRSTLAYKTIIEAIHSPDTPISCGTKVGTGRFSASKSWQSECAIILTLAHIQYDKGNSSPRGGMAGDNIAVHFPSHPKLPPTTWP